MIVSPSNKFEEYRFVNNDRVSEVPANLNLNRTVTLTENGNYILEINDASGKAVLNRPVYVFTEDSLTKIPGVPIVPDFESLKPNVSNIGEILREQPKSKDEREQLVLDLINQERR